MSYSDDALLRSSMTNRLTDGQSLDYFSQKLKDSGRIDPGIDKNGALDKLNQILDKTTIKRGCCMRNPNQNKVTVAVTIPQPKGFEPDTSTKLGQIYDKFKIYDQKVDVTKSVCNSLPNYIPGSVECDNFYTVYCKNILEQYKKANGGNFDYTEFSFYKPECACYAPVPEWISKWRVPPMCYMPSCIKESESRSYLDSLSRAGDCGNITLCNAGFSASDIAAGGDATITSRIIQNCGQSSDFAKEGMGDNGDNGNNGNNDNNENDHKIDDDNTLKYVGISGAGTILSICCLIIILVIIWQIYGK